MLSATGDSKAAGEVSLNSVASNSEVVVSLGVSSNSAASNSEVVVSLGLIPCAPDSSGESPDVPAILEDSSSISSIGTNTIVGSGGKHP